MLKLDQEKGNNRLLTKIGGYKEAGFDDDKYPDWYSIYDVLIEFYSPKLGYETALFVQFISNQLIEWLNTKNPFHMDMIVYAHASRKTDLDKFFMKHLSDASVYRLNNDDKSSPIKIKKKFALDDAMMIMINLTFESKNSQSMAALKAAYQIFLKYKQRVYKSSNLLKEFEKLKRDGVVDFYHEAWKRQNLHLDQARQSRIDSFPIPEEDLAQFLKGERR